MKDKRPGDVPDYEDRFVAYIDILGFSSLVERAESDAQLLKSLVMALQEVREYNTIRSNMDELSTNDPSKFWYNMFQMSTFSDNVVMSTKLNPIGLGLVTSIAAIMCNRLLHQGIFTRGAISRGKLIHTGEVVIGAGLINAYKLEKTATFYPRILLDNILKPDLEVVSKGGSIDLRRKDFDGQLHLHILHPLLLKMGADLWNKGETAYMDKAREEIERVLQSECDPATSVKINWLARYFNEYATDSGLKQITIPA